MQNDFIDDHDYSHQYFIRIQSTYRTFKSYILLLLNTTVRHIPPGQPIKVHVRDPEGNHQEWFYPCPYPGGLFTADDFPIPLSQCEENFIFQSIEEYIHHVKLDLNDLLGRAIPNDLSEDQQELINNIASQLLQLSSLFYHCKKYEIVIDILKTGGNLLRKLRKIKLFRRKFIQLHEFWSKQSDQLLGMIALGHQEYELALAYFISGLNDLNFFNSENENRPGVECFYSIQIARTYFQFKQLAKAEAYLNRAVKIFKRSSQKSLQLLSCWKGTIVEFLQIIGDDIRSNTPLKAIQYYLEIIDLNPNHPLDTIRDKINHCYREKGAEEIAIILQKWLGPFTFLQVDQSFCHIGVISLKCQYSQYSSLTESMIMQWHEKHSVQCDRNIKTNWIRLSSIEQGFQIQIFCNSFSPAPNVILSMMRELFRTYSNQRQKELYHLSKSSEISQYAPFELISKTPNEKRHKKSGTDLSSECSASKPSIPPLIATKRNQKKSQRKKEPSFSEEITDCPHKEELLSIQWKNVSGKLMTFPSTQKKECFLHQLSNKQFHDSPICLFGEYWYGYIEQSVFKRIQDPSVCISLFSVLDRGKVGDFGNAIKVVRVSGISSLFFKIKDRTQCGAQGPKHQKWRVIGKRTSTSEIGHHPLYCFNKLALKGQ